MACVVLRCFEPCHVIQHTTHVTRHSTKPTSDLQLSSWAMIFMSIACSPRPEKSASFVFGATPHTDWRLGVDSSISMTVLRPSSPIELPSMSSVWIATSYKSEYAGERACACTHARAHTHTHSRARKHARMLSTHSHSLLVNLAASTNFRSPQQAASMVNSKRPASPKT